MSKGKNGAPLQSHSSIDLDTPRQNSRGEYVHQLSFPGVFSSLDVLYYADWDNDTVVWVYEGLPHATYMGQMESQERRANLTAFRAGEITLLVATDLGGRGLDIDRVDRVINVHLPRDLDNYKHRVGRTARAGRAGLVVNLVTERDLPLIEKLKRREKERG